jgi:hypothetical protein
MKRGVSRFPPSQLRLREEDLMRESDAVTKAAEQEANAWTLMDDY